MQRVQLSSTTDMLTGSRVLVPLPPPQLRTSSATPHLHHAGATLRTARCAAHASSAQDDSHSDDLPSTSGSSSSSADSRPIGPRNHSASHGSATGSGSSADASLGSSASDITAQHRNGGSDDDDASSVGSTGSGSSTGSTSDADTDDANSGTGSNRLRAQLGAAAKPRTSPVAGSSTSSRHDAAAPGSNAVFLGSKNKRKQQPKRAQKPGFFEVEEVSPPPESLGIHVLPPKTHNGDQLSVRCPCA